MVKGRYILIGGAWPYANNSLHLGHMSGLISGDDVGNKFEKLEFREAVNTINDLISEANLYYDNKKPWVQKKENIEEFNKIMFTCATIIANLSNLLEPIIPTSCEKLRKYLKIKKASWQLITFENNIILEDIKPLFGRLVKSV